MLSLVAIENLELHPSGVNIIDKLNFYAYLSIFIHIDLAKDKRTLPIILSINYYSWIKAL